jgi:hypothetical protein
MKSYITFFAGGVLELLQHGTLLCLQSNQG